MESMMRNRELSETMMMQELASAKRRAEEERAGHNATKMAAMEREVELEHRAIESSIALAWIQLTVADERTAKATKLEQKVALLEVLRRHGRKNWSVHVKVRGKLKTSYHPWRQD
ncbi:hypothetical protein JHK87_047505 [Glycine soja]|nr:hypothetical protein JHK87_047505 [Glycine soja]